MLSCRCFGHQSSLAIHQSITLLLPCLFVVSIIILMFDYDCISFHPRTQIPTHLSLLCFRQAFPAVVPLTGTSARIIVIRSHHSSLHWDYDLLCHPVWISVCVLSFLISKLPTFFLRYLWGFLPNLLTMSSSQTSVDGRPHPDAAISSPLAASSTPPVHAVSSYSAGNPSVDIADLLSSLDLWSLSA